MSDTDYALYAPYLCAARGHNDLVIDHALGRASFTRGELDYNLAGRLYEILQVGRAYGNRLVEPTSDREKWAFVDDLAKRLLASPGSDETSLSGTFHFALRAWAMREELRRARPLPIPMILHCPKCSTQHVDKGAWVERAHRTHRCESCEHEWRPSNLATVGVGVLG